MVNALKRRKSSGRCHGSALPRPMARLRSSAATRLTRNAVPPPGIGTPGFSTASVTTRSLPPSPRHRRLYRRQRVVAFAGDGDVAETEYVAIDEGRIPASEPHRHPEQLPAQIDSAGMIKL